MASDDCVARFSAPDLGKHVAEFARRGGNLSDLMDVLAEGLVAAVGTQFEEEAGHTQGAWPELAESTLEQEGRESGSTKILQDSGALAAVLPFAGDDVAEAYTNVPYAKFHVSKAPRTKIPLRDFLDIDWEFVTNEAMELVLGELAT